MFAGGSGAPLAQRTCVLVPHRVSHDATEDSPTGHADGNGTGTGKKFVGKEIKTVSRENVGRGGMVRNGVERVGKDCQYITLFPLDS